MMNENERYLAELDGQIKQAEPQLKLAKALERLKLNPDFKEVVLKGYLEDSAVRLVHLRADAAAQAPESQAAILRGIDGIASFHAYLHTIVVQGRVAERQTNDAEAQREEVLKEEQE